MFSKLKGNIRLIVLLIILFVIILFSLNYFFDLNIKKIKIIDRDKYMSEELRQKYLADRLFCLRNRDCVVQRDCFCCNYVVNKYNREEVVCEPGSFYCDAICRPFKAKCIDNKCQEVYK